MSLGQDIIDIYTKSSVYYLRLQYLVVCYLMVLAAAFFVLPLPREMGINGNTRLMVGGLLYIGFAVLLVYAPKLFYPLIGKLLSPYKDEKEVQEKFNQLSEKDKRELKKELKAEYGNEDFTIMNKKQRISTNLFFQCLLIELFCLVVLINSDQSLMISNSITQHLSNVLSNHVELAYRDGKFFSISVISSDPNASSYHIYFDKYIYMAESIFFIYIVFIISLIVRLILLFIFSRPILERDDIFPIVKNVKKTGKKMWAILATLIMLFVCITLPLYITHELYPYISSILVNEEWIYRSVLLNTVGILNILIFFRFMEDWYKLIFRKF